MAKGCMSTAFFIFTTQLYQYFSVLFALLSDKPEVFLPEYSQTTILHAVHSQRVLNSGFTVPPLTDRVPPPPPVSVGRSGRPQ